MLVVFQRCLKNVKVVNLVLDLLLILLPFEWAIEPNVYSTRLQ